MAAAEGDGEIIADKQARVYYSGACRPATEVKAANRISFATIEEAEKARPLFRVTIANREAW